MDAVKPSRVEVLGVPVDCVGMASAVGYVDALITSGTGAAAILAVNPEKVMRAREDPRLHNVLNRAGLLIPDGIGIVVAVRMLKLGSIKRVPGSELMPAICELAAEKGYRVFLFGGTAEVNLGAKVALVERYPSLNIVGARDGYVKDSEIPGLIDEINRSRAQILFVALGSPKQELWMADHLPQLNIRVCQGVGGTFDVLAGRVKRAPLAFRRVHLEWLYRLVKQPARLLRQTALPRFAFTVVLEWAGVRRTSSR